MQCNVIRNGDVLTADTFVDLKKCLNNGIVTMQSLDSRHDDVGIRKLIVKDSKCSLTVDEIKRCLVALNKLKEIDIITEDERFCTVDGMLYSKNKRRLYFCPRGIDGTLVIPTGTDIITANSCGNCNLSKVIIPDSVKRIDSCAFARDYALEYVDGCKNVERVGDYAFADCQQLKKFPFGDFIKSIGSCAFCDTMLTEIYLPEGLSRVGVQAFDTISVVPGFNTLVE